jgi:hypothetical protein
VVVKGIAGSFGLPRVVDGYPNNGDAIASAKLLHILIEVNELVATRIALWFQTSSVAVFLITSKQDYIMAALFTLGFDDSLLAHKNGLFL